MSQAGINSVQDSSGVVFSVTGENGVTASPTSGNVVVSGVDATTSTVGVASFNPLDFTVTAGEVSLIGSGGAPIQTVTGNSGGAETPDSSGNFNVLGTGSITVAGSTNTETVELTGLTAHSVLVGAGTATITKVGPTATSGQVLQSQGSTTDPAFSTATYPATTTVNQILYSSSANTVAGLSTADNGVLITGTTGTPSVLANSGTPGYVLTANSGAPASWQANSVTQGIVTVDGDSGSITGETVTIYADQAANNAGQTVEFVNSGTTSTFNVTDSSFNTMIGKLAGKLSQTYTECTAVGWSAGNSLTSGTLNTLFGLQAGLKVTSGGDNTYLGAGAGQAATTGSNNTAVGQNCLSLMTTGGSNIAIGAGTASNYDGGESSNIIIGNSGGGGDSNTIRVGITGNSPGQQNICYIAGITGASPVSGNTPQVVVCDSNGNLTPISSSTSGYVLTSNGSATPSFQAGGGGFTPVNFSVKLSGNISNVTGDGTNYAILYDTVVFNNGGGTYSSVTGLYTVPTTGIYQINLTHFIFGGSVADTIFLGYLLINGSTNIRLMDANPGPLGLSVNGEFMQSATYLYSATAGDTIGAYVDVNGGTKNVGVAGGSESCLFSGFRVA